MADHETSILYGLSDLKVQFPSLSGTHEKLLPPLLDSALYAWIRSLPNDVVRDYHEEPSYPDIGIERYTFDVNGTLIMGIRCGKDVDVVDPDESLYMTYSVELIGEEKPTTAAYTNMRSFIGAQSLNDLFKLSREELERHKPEHLEQVLRQFYFPEA